MTEANKFKIGETYGTPSICDSECIFRFTIEARTEKTVTIKYHNRTVRRKIRLEDGNVETIDPHGRYSMSPVLRATDLNR